MYHQNDVAVNNFIVSFYPFLYHNIQYQKIKNIQRIQECDQMISQHIVKHYSFHSKLKYIVHSLQIILLLTN